MSAQPKALFLADVIESDLKSAAHHDEAAAELRRLSAENAELWKEREEPHKTIEMYLRECNRLERERDALRQIVQDFPPIEAELAEVSDRAHRLEAQRDALRAELKEATEAINDPAANNLRTLAESIRMLSNQRDALLEALKMMRDKYGEYACSVCDHADAAIKAVEENT